jgi:hypothetical protein
VPIKDNILSEDIKIDALHFRCLVAKTMANELNIRKLPMSFKLFFSEICTDGIKSADIQIVKDYSFLQIFHPVFFDSIDRTNFVHLKIQYRMKNETAFIAYLNLGDPSYGLSKWMTKLNRKNLAYNFLSRAQCVGSNLYYTDIPPHIFFSWSLLQINWECGFFEWVGPKLCEYGKKVAGRLREWHESLMAEARWYEIMVEVEVGKVKTEMEKEVDKIKAEIEKQVGKMKTEMDNEIAQYRKEIEIVGIKFQAMKKNYQTMLVCLWILFAFYFFFFGYASKNQHNRRIGRMMLPWVVRGSRSVQPFCVVLLVFFFFFVVCNHPLYLFGGCNEVGDL